jgi:hypothetical protein
MVSWKDIYAWASGHKNDSQWARFLIDYFKVSETKMAAQEYFKEGTITQFSGKARVAAAHPKAAR